MSNYNPKQVYTETAQHKRDASPWHTFVRRRKEANIFIQVNPAQSGFRWGFDARSVDTVLGSGFEYYKDNMGKSTKRISSLVLGSSKFALRHVHAVGVVYSIILLALGLWGASMGKHLWLIPVVVVRIVSYLYFEDVFCIRFVETYKKYTPLYQSIPETVHAKIMRQLGEDALSVGIFCLVELLIVLISIFVSQVV